MTDLQGQRAIITGAGSGVGRATSLALARAGVTVGLFGRRPSRLEAVAEGVRTEGGTAVILPGDVCDESSVHAMVERFTAACGGLDILINNAGIGRYGPIESYSLSDWHETLQTNITGVFLCTRAAIPYMRQQGSGYIISLSSGAGRHGGPTLSAYAASKFAVIGFMESAAAELGPFGIKCSTILPGSVMTDFGMDSLEEKQARIDKKYLEPDDVSEAIINLLRQSDRGWTQELNLWPF